MTNRSGWIGLRRADPFTLSPDAFNVYVRTEIQSTAKIAKAASLKAQ
jgi:hypothetical protein